MIHPRTALFSLVVAFGIHAPSAGAQTPSDSSAIRQTALDYIEGWYEGNAERMERALHPELAKRIVNTDARGRSSLGELKLPAPLPDSRRSASIHWTTTE